MIIRSLIEPSMPCPADSFSASFKVQEVEALRYPNCSELLLAREPSEGFSVHSPTSHSQQRRLSKLSACFYISSSPTPQLSFPTHYPHISRILSSMPRRSLSPLP